MRLSIRNQLDGVVVAVTRGEVMATVRTRLAGGYEIVAAITLDAVDDLGIAEGQAVTVLIKSTEVAVATGPIPATSIRNQISGNVTGVDRGAVMTTVKVLIAGGQQITAAITRDAADELTLAEGDTVTALIKSTEVSIAV
jgi:molybdate transport system regulatory protein